MENPRAEKVAVVNEVKSRFEQSQAAVLTEYRGLNVTAMAQLRTQLRAAGGTYRIYKNTLVRFAARDLGLDLADLLTGTTAIAFVDGDAAAVAKVLRDYARTNPALVVKGGLLDDRVISADDVRELADLPSREQLLSEVAGLLAAPMQQFASLLDAVPRSFAYALQALIDEGGAPGAPSPAVAVETAPAPVETAPDTTEEPAETPAADAADLTPAADAVDTTPVAADAAPDTTPAADAVGTTEED